MMKKILFALPLLLTPAFAFAQVRDIGGVFELINRFINAVIPLLIGVATLWLIWQVFQYIKEDDKKAAGERIGWGIVGLAVMVSIWGLVAILTTTVGLDSGAAIQPPQVPSINFR